MLTNSIPWRQLLIVRGSPITQNLEGSVGYGSYGHITVNTIVLECVRMWRRTLECGVVNYNVANVSISDTYLIPERF